MLDTAIIMIKTIMITIILIIILLIIILLITIIIPVHPHSLNDPNPPSLQSLYPVLELLVDDADAVLQQAARTSLDRISIYLGYSTTANLLKYVLRTYPARYCIFMYASDRYTSD